MPLSSSICPLSLMQSFDEQKTLFRNLKTRIRQPCNSMPLGRIGSVTYYNAVRIDYEKDRQPLARSCADPFLLWIIGLLTGYCYIDDLISGTTLQ